MSRFAPLMSGRQARRAARFGPGGRRRGAGWTRAFRVGREQRLPYTDDQKLMRGMISLDTHKERAERAAAEEAEGEN